MSRSLYEIDQDIMSCVDKETGELDVDKLDVLKVERKAKLEKIALWIKNLENDINGIKGEVQNQLERIRKKEYKLLRLKKYLSDALDGQGFETAKVDVRFRKTTRVNITDYSKIPDVYMRYKQPEPDRKALRAALSIGIEIEGVTLTDNLSMSVK